MATREYDRAYYQANKEKINERAKKWKKANREKINRYARNHRANHLEKVRGKDRKRFTGFTSEMFKSRIESQNFRCAICKTSLKVLSNKEVHADHCHTTEKKRGVLCRKCNLLLGFANDDKLVLMRAIEYLDLWELV